MNAPLRIKEIFMKKVCIVSASSLGEKTFSLQECTSKNEKKFTWRKYAKTNDIYFHGNWLHCPLLGGMLHNWHVATVCHSRGRTQLLVNQATGALLNKIISREKLHDDAWLCHYVTNETNSFLNYSEIEANKRTNWMENVNYFSVKKKCNRFKITN